MRRLKLLLLGGTALFNLCFWLLISNRYQLQGFLLGYPNTVWVGSIALVLLAYLTASVRQTLPPRPAQAVNWHVLGQILPLFVLFVSGVCVLAVVWWVTLILLVTVLGVFGTKSTLVPALLLAVLLSYVASAWLLHGVALVWQDAALPKPAALVATTLVAVSLGLAFAWVGAWGFFWVEGDAPSDAQRFLSPSGQHTLVFERRDDPDGEPGVRVYVESGWWLRELTDPPDVFRSCMGTSPCTDTDLRLRWSADEKQIAWQNGSEHGQWQW